MRPIDYAIKLIVAYNMKIDMFNDLTESLYYEDNLFIDEVMECLKENDTKVFNAIQDEYKRL